MKPFPYQAEGIKKLAEFDGRALLADEMGLGKTLQALWYITQSESYPAVIVCPASLKMNWQREAAKVGINATIVQGKKTAATFDFTGIDCIIINYDILDAWQAQLIKWKPSILVLDECHYVQSRSAKRTKATKALSRKCDKIIAISGTPLTNRPSELWSVLNMLMPKDYPAFSRFAARYCKPRMTPWGWSYDGAQNLKELHRNLTERCMIRRLKKDVLKDLPPKSVNVHVLEIDDYEQYVRAKQDFVGWLRDQDPKALRKALRALAISKVSHLKRLAAKLKVNALKDYFDNVLEETGEKIVISCVHHAMIDLLMEHFGDKAVKIDGRDDMKTRDQSVERFQNDKTVKVFVGQLKAAGVGLTLTASSKVYFAECGWTPGEHAQMQDRVHRIGQTDPCSATYLVAGNTIEEQFVEVLQNKTETVTKILDGDDNIGNQNIFDQLLDLKEFMP